MNQVNNDKKVLQVCSVDKSWTEIHSEKHLGLFLQGVLKGRKIIFYHDKNPQCSTYWSERLKWLQIQRSPSHFQHSHNMKLHNTNLKQTDPNIHSRIKWGETSVCIRWNEHQNSNCFSGSFYSKSSSNKPLTVTSAHKSITSYDRKIQTLCFSRLLKTIFFVF